jgi:ribonuclease Z
MRSVFFPRLVNGPFGDPALHVRLAYRGEALLFDCGDLHALAPGELLKTRLLFLSHAHIDHLVGFDLLLRTFLARDLTLLMYGPAGLAQQIAARLQGYTWNLVDGYPFVLTVREWLPEGIREVSFPARQAFRPLSERMLTCHNQILHETPWYRVRGARLAHGDIVSLAFSLEEPLHVAIHKDALERHNYRPGHWLSRFKDLVMRAASLDTPVTAALSDGSMRSVPLGELLDTIASTERGMKVVYVTDCSPVFGNFRRILDLSQNAHLLTIEAMFAHRDLERARQRNHLTAWQAGRLARLARVARLQVFHHSPRYQGRPDDLGREALAAFAGENAPPCARNNGVLLC